MGESDGAALNAANVRERELELALARIARMHTRLPVERKGRVVSYGAVSCGSLEEAADIARAALRGDS